MTVPFAWARWDPQQLWKCCGIRKGAHAVIRGPGYVSFPSDEDVTRRLHGEHDRVADAVDDDADPAALEVERGGRPRPDARIGHPVEQLDVELQLVPLIFGDIKVNRIVLSGADILLETDKQGRSNWQFGDSKPAKAPGAAPAGTPAQGSDATHLPQIDKLSIAVKEELATQLTVLRAFGPRLGRPAVDTLNGSRHANMKELRFKAEGGVWRFAFAFDSKRRAIVLCGGDKST